MWRPNPVSLSGYRPVTDRIRSMGEGNVFTGVCLFTGGLPPELLPGGWVSYLRGVSFPREGCGCLVRGGWLSGQRLGVSGQEGSRHAPPKMATAAVGTHPTGMHSCCVGDHIQSQCDF